MSNFNWFSTNNQAQLADESFLLSLGITMQRPSGEVVYLSDENTGRTMGLLGVAFVMTDGSVRIRPRNGVGDAGRARLLRIGVDCIERDLHKRERWTYRRKTSKQSGYWMTYLWAAIEQQSEMAREIATLHLAMQGPAEARSFGIGERDTLSPELEGTQ